MLRRATINVARFSHNDAKVRPESPQTGTIGDHRCLTHATEYSTLVPGRFDTNDPPQLKEELWIHD